MRKLWLTRVAVLAGGLWIVFALTMTARGMRGRAEVRSLADTTGHFVADWRRYSETGHREGVPLGRGPIVVTFNNFRCSRCQALMRSVDSLKTLNPRATFIEQYFFGPRTSGGGLAGEALQCGEALGAYQTIREAFLKHVTEIEDADWSSVARSVHLGSPDRFAECLRTHRYAASVADRQALATQLGVAQPPFILINDSLYTGPMSLAGLQRRLADVNGIAALR